MTARGLAASPVAPTALVWLGSIGSSAHRGFEIASRESAAVRDHYGHIRLAERLRDTPLRAFGPGELRVTHAEHLLAGASGDHDGRT